MSETIASSDTGQGQGADAPSSGERVKRDSLVLYGSMIDVQGTGDNGSDKEPEGSDSKIGDSDASAMLAQGDELSASSVGTDESNGDAPGEAAAASEGEEGESTGESREEKPDGGASDSDANAGVEMKDSRAGGERTWRVKLYQLREEDGQWADKGTGNVEWETFAPNSEGKGGVVGGATSGRTVLGIRLKVSNEVEPFNTLYAGGGINPELYLRQGDTIITWSEEIGGVTADLALSFQDTEGCLQVWNAIDCCKGENAKFGMSLSFSGSEASDGDAAVQAVSLPSTPTKENLYQVLEVFSNIPPASHGALAKYICETDKSFLPKLLELFEELEKDSLESAPDIDSFHRLFHVFRGFVQLNHSQIFELLFSDENWMRFVGVLEYNPVANPRCSPVVDIYADKGTRRTGEVRYCYRDYLSSKVVFKQVAPFQNRTILSRIHINFRVSYLQNSVDGVITEDVSSTLAQMNMFNNNDIIMMMSNDKVFMTGLLASLGCGEARQELTRWENVVPKLNLHMPVVALVRIDALRCLKELCVLSQSIQAATKHSFYRALYTFGGGNQTGASLFGTMSHILADRDSTVEERMITTEILYSCVTNNPMKLRSYLCSQGHHPENIPGTSSVDNSFHEGDYQDGDFASTPASHEKTENSFSLESSDKDSQNTHTPSSNKDRGAYSGGKMDAAGNASSSDAGGLSYVTAGKDGKLLQRLCARLTGDNSEAVQLQCLHLLKELLDPENMEAKEKEEFVAIFYDHYVQWLVYALSRCPGPRRDSDGAGEGKGYSLAGIGHPATPRSAQTAPAGGPEKAELFSPGDLGGKLDQSSEAARSAWVHVVDLLSFCVEKHQYRIKSYMLHNNVIAKVCRLLNCREKYVKLTAIRFVRKCVSLRDDFYNRYIVKNRLLTPIFKLFCENGPRDNLINSSIIELVDFISREDIALLKSHIVRVFHSESEDKGPVSFDFSEIDYVSTFTELLLLFNSNVKSQEDFTQASASSVDTDNLMGQEDGYEWFGKTGGKRDREDGGELLGSLVPDKRSRLTVEDIAGNDDDFAVNNGSDEKLLGLNDLFEDDGGVNGV
jgi:hypothetical protein